MDKITLHASERELVGKAAKRLRREGKVPAVIYGHKVKPASLTLDGKELEKAYSKAGGNKVIAIKIGEGRPVNAIFQDAQSDGVTGHLTHVDFFAVRMDEKIKTEVPLRFTGESTAVYQMDGTLLKNLEAVEIEALPADLPESIKVDISILDDFEKTIHVSDLEIPANVTLLTEPEELVAKVEEPRSEAELAELEEEVVEEIPAEEGAEAVSEGEKTEESAS